MIYFSWQVKELLKAKDDEIAFLLDQAKNLAKQLEDERSRANLAVDRLLNQSGMGGITVERREPKPFDDLLSKQLEIMATVGGEIEGEKGNAG